VIDKSSTTEGLDRLRYLDEIMLNTIYSPRAYAIAASTCRRADLVVGAVLVPGAARRNS
jgi:alanine dehydrogenase